MELAQAFESQTWAQNHILSLISCVTLQKALNLSEPHKQCPGGFQSGTPASERNHFHKDNYYTSICLKFNKQLINLSIIHFPILKTFY